MPLIALALVLFGIGPLRPGAFYLTSQRS
jgi:hypothetical protein